ncbi:aminodeoxychorismate synthase component I [Nocardia albiluteola]|nr:aminodeoxychorismate synthase component I [Nocardia albiluteola]
MSTPLPGGHTGPDGHEAAGHARPAYAAPHRTPGAPMVRASGPGDTTTPVAPRTARTRPGGSPVAPPRAADETIALSVLHETIGRAIDTEAIFLALYRNAEHAFWLDSTHAEPGLDRFSYLGDARGPLAEVVRYRVGSGRVEVDRHDGRHIVPGTVFDYLAIQLRDRKIEFPDVPFDFAGGYVGYLGYEMKADCGGAAHHRAPAPDAQWIFADRLIVVDHVAERTHLIALATPKDVAGGRDWLTATRAVLAELPERSTLAGLELPTDEREVHAGLVRGRERYLADIEDVLTQLRAGETYEVNLTDNVHVEQDCDGLDVYRVLRRSNPAPYAAFLRLGETEIACSSPERFLKVDRDRTVESRPIKGTAPRGATPELDEILRRTLESDPKTRAENLMIVDLLRNDLGRVCELGTVRVPALMRAETYTTMHQLVTTIRGRLRPDVDAVACLRACFPGGSMTGAPKLRTMEIIDRLETEARGIYSGTIGFLALGGAADLNIVIRTAVRHDGRWRIGAGGAIVLDSDPEQEFHEMVLKAAAALRAVTLVARKRALAGRP